MKMVGVCFIGRENRDNLRNPQTCRKSLINFFTYKKRERKGTLSYKNKLGDLVSMLTINDPHISWKLNLQLPM
jgi:hypothetical protein